MVTNRLKWLLQLVLCCGLFVELCQSQGSVEFVLIVPLRCDAAERGNPPDCEKSPFEFAIGLRRSDSVMMGSAKCAEDSVLCSNGDFQLRLRFVSHGLSVKFGFYLDHGRKSNANTQIKCK